MERRGGLREKTALGAGGKTRGCGGKKQNLMAKLKYPRPHSNCMIGILSDSHDQIDNVEKAVALFAGRKVDLVAHAGDIVSPFVWPFFSTLNVPIKCVFGNNKGDVEEHKNVTKKLGLDIEFADGLLEFSHSGKRFALHHGNIAGQTERLAQSGKYDVVVCGHDHFPKVERKGGTLVMNPGSLVGKLDSPLNILRDRPRPSVALYDEKTNGAEILPL